MDDGRGSVDHYSAKGASFSQENTEKPKGRRREGEENGEKAKSLVGLVENVGK